MNKNNGIYGKENLDGYQDNEDTLRDQRGDGSRVSRPKMFNPSLVNEENIDALKFGYQMGKQ